MIEIADEKEFNKLLSENEYVLVKFYTTWCGPCKLLTPQYLIASEKIKNVTFTELNAEHVTTIAKKYGVSSVPTVIFFKNNEEIAKFTGFRAADAIVDFITENKS